MTRFNNSLIHLGKCKQKSSITGVSVLPPLILEKKFSTKRVKRLSTSTYSMKFGLSSITFVFTLERPSRIMSRWQIMSRLVLGSGKLSL